MKLAVVAGEASGDLHASEVIRELKRLDPELAMFGIGGDLLAREGMELLHHNSEIAYVGFFNVLRHIPMFRRVLNELMERVAKERPDAVLLVDYPGFNLAMARRCKELGLKVAYYISPQVWAWRQGRVRQIARYVDEMIVILPFEEDFFRKHKVPVTYVGHPIIEQLDSIARAPRPNERLRVALLPGSRKHEVETLLPAMLQAIDILRHERKVDASLIQAPTIDRETLTSIIKKQGVDMPIVPHDRGETVAAADVALSSSGTATLEAAVLGTPSVVMYRLSLLNYLLAKIVVKVPYFGLVNIIAGNPVLPELIQKDVNGKRIADEVRRLVAPGNYERVRAELDAVREKLGQPGASRRAAAEVYKLANG